MILKKAIILVFFLLSVLPIYSLITYNSQFISANNGEKINFKSSKIEIIVVFSAISCHECYESLGRELKQYIQSNKIKLRAIVNVDESNARKIFYRKIYIEEVKHYFPYVEEVLFNCKKNDGFYEVFEKSINNYKLPAVFVFENTKVHYFELTEIFSDKNYTLSLSFSNLLKALSN